MSADTRWDFDDEPETEPRSRSNGKANTEPPGSKPADQPWHENIRPISWPDKTGWSAPYRRFVAKGWIPYGCVTSLYGQGGIGKSMVAQLLGTAASLGQTLARHRDRTVQGAGIVLRG
jgi:hypothetical protein